MINMPKDLKSIITHYKKWRKENPDTWIAHCKGQKKLTFAIMFAALSENQQGKRNPHQYRLKKIVLERFAANLADRESAFKQARSFDEVLKLAEGAKVHGIGPLTVYDAAFRIGAYLNVYPDKVYLHAGTRTGAEKLLGMKIKARFLEIEDFPPAFANSGLLASEIEDILCIYKDSFDSELASLNKPRC